MRVYQYDPDVDNYDGLKATSKGDKVLAQIKGSPLVATWTPVSMQVDVESGVMGEFPSAAGHFFPVFSEHAWSVLQPHLGNHVEALPLLCKAGKFLAINVVTVEDCLDEDESEFDRLANGKIYAIDSYVFKKGIKIDSPIFRIPQDPNEIHVTDVFRDLVTRNKLKGLLWHAVGKIG